MLVVRTPVYPIDDVVLATKLLEWIVWSPVAIPFLPTHIASLSSWSNLGGLN